ATFWGGHSGRPGRAGVERQRRAGVESRAGRRRPVAERVAAGGEANLPPAGPGFSPNSGTPPVPPPVAEVAALPVTTCPDVTVPGSSATSGPEGAEPGTEFPGSPVGVTAARSACRRQALGTSLERALAWSAEGGSECLAKSRRTSVTGSSPAGPVVG